MIKKVYQPNIKTAKQSKQVYDDCKLKLAEIRAAKQSLVTSCLREADKSSLNDVRKSIMES